MCSNHGMENRKRSYSKQNQESPKWFFSKQLYLCLEIREWNIRYGSYCLKEVIYWLWDRVQQTLSYNSLRIPLGYTRSGNVGAFAVIIPNYPNKNLFQSSCGSLYRKYNLPWNKCLPSIPSLPAPNRPCEHLQTILEVVFLTQTWVGGGS